MKNAIKTIRNATWAERERVLAAVLRACQDSLDTGQLRHRMDEITRALCIDCTPEVWRAACAIWEALARGKDASTAVIDGDE